MLCTAPYRALQALVPPLDAPEQRLDRLRQFDAQLQYDECHGVRLSAFSARSCRPNRVPHRRAQAQSRLPLSGTGGAGAKRPGRHRARRYNRQGRESPPGSLLRLAARSPTPADGGSRSPNTRRRRITITPPKADHDHPAEGGSRSPAEGGSRSRSPATRRSRGDHPHQQRGEAAAIPGRTAGEAPRRPSGGGGGGRVGNGVLGTSAGSLAFFDMSFSKPTRTCGSTGPVRRRIPPATP